MVTRTFALLTLLLDLWKDDERWQANVRGSGVAEGLTLSAEEDDEDVEAVQKDFACDELEFVDDKVVYDFMGSEHEQERFYNRDEQVYRDKATGRYWLMYYDGMEAF